MSHTTLALLAVVVLITIAKRCVASELQQVCLPCDDPKCDNTVPTSCEYGLTRDVCGRPICAKGPGQRCGGSLRSMGTCAENLTCKCEICTGCAKKYGKDYECYDHDFLCEF